MSIADALTENVVAARSPGIRRDAEALLSAALWRDFAEVAIVEETVPGLDGRSFGSGHWLAQATGCRPGTVAIRVAVQKIIRSWLERSPDDLDLAIEGATISIERVAAHEIAHVMVAPPDGDVDREKAIAYIQRADDADSKGTPERQLDGHRALWAAAYVLAAGRCARLRREDVRGLWRSWVAADLTRYGHDAAALEAAIGDVPDDVPLRELLMPAGEVASRVHAAAKPDDVRLDIIRRELFNVPPTSEPLVAASWTPGIR